MTNQNSFLRDLYLEKRRKIRKEKRKKEKYLRKEDGGRKLILRDSWLRKC